VTQLLNRSLQLVSAWQYNNEQPQAFSLNAPANAIISKDCTASESLRKACHFVLSLMGGLLDVLMQCQTLLSSPQRRLFQRHQRISTDESRKGAILSENC